jgi:hypothetical protein
VIKWVRRPIVVVVICRHFDVLYRFANACTVWGDLFNRPVCGFIQSGKKRE